jgi:hypothetical protein
VNGHTSQDTSFTSVKDRSIAHLTALEAELDKAGWPSRLETAFNRVPSLYVRNPAPGAESLSDHVYAAPSGDIMVFWWSWAEPITAEPADAAQKIMRALRASHTAI